MVNQVTPYVRSCVNLWLAGCTLAEFTVSELIQALEGQHETLVGVDLCKAISNELIRLETQHKLLSRKGVKGFDGCGQGRPPRVYRRNMIFKADPTNGSRQ